MADMVDLKYTPKELKEEKVEAKGGPQVDPYPWGLAITLDSETLDKLKLMDPLPQVGDEVHMLCVCKVTSVNRAATAQDDECRVGLQITMAQVLLVESAKDEKGEKETPAAEAKESKRPATVMGY